MRYANILFLLIVIFSSFTDSKRQLINQKDIIALDLDFEVVNLIQIKDKHKSQSGKPTNSLKFQIIKKNNDLKQL